MNQTIEIMPMQEQFDRFMKPSTLLSELSGDPNVTFHSCGGHICVDNDILEKKMALAEICRKRQKIRVELFLFHLEISKTRCIYMYL